MVAGIAERRLAAGSKIGILGGDHAADDLADALDRLETEAAPFFFGRILHDDGGIASAGRDVARSVALQPHVLVACLPECLGGADAHARSFLDALLESLSGTPVERGDIDAHGRRAAEHRVAEVR